MPVKSGELYCIAVHGTVCASNAGQTLVGCTAVHGTVNSGRLC